jgi:hypothetical protein
MTRLLRTDNGAREMVQAAGTIREVSLPGFRQFLAAE